MKGPKAPVDHSRTTRPHAGESMKDNKIMPGLVVIGVVRRVPGRFCQEHTDVGLTLAALSAVGFTLRN
jgi:hypothetical protein